MVNDTRNKAVCVSGAGRRIVLFPDANYDQCQGFDGAMFLCNKKGKEAISVNSYRVKAQVFDCGARLDNSF